MNFDTVISVPFKQGQRKDGVDKGTEHLFKLLQESKCNLITDDLTLITVYSKQTNIDISNNLWKQDYQQLFNICKNYKRKLLLGGDHTVGQSSVLSSMCNVDNPEDLLVIWIDAHADLNTYEASVTKNFHGMPLAGVVGFEDNWIDYKKTLPTNNLLYFGIRDLDDYEEEQIKKYNIFRTKDLKILINKIEQKLFENSKMKIHISWDVDGLDPSFISSTGTTAPNGLTPDDIINLFDYLDHSKIITLDIVEFNPLLGDCDKSDVVMLNIFNKLKTHAS